MTASRLETFLARIYVDDAAREQFLADPRGEAMRAGLCSDEIEHLVNIDRDGLEMFAHSLQHKKLQHKKAQELQRGAKAHERGTKAHGHHKNHNR